jgi:hypothetical protein
VSDPVDWSATTFEGNRGRQHQEFYSLSLREKLERLEHLEELGLEAHRIKARARCTSGSHWNAGPGSTFSF